MGNNKLVIKLKRAWIITWEWNNDSASIVDKIAGIIDYRRGRKRIIDLVEFLYNLKISDISELADYAKNRKNIPYKANVDFNNQITCGHHPYLYARQVKNIEVFVDSHSKIETISWETFPTQEPTDSCPQKNSDTEKEEFKRIIIGPLSFDYMWDRKNGKIKEQYLKR
ncbi:MAG: hypothetical protein Q7J67_00350 [bacterium]|nr:hypothetical protein [bacterium]